MLVYLSGPMSGYDEFNFPAFNEAAAVLRAAGDKVLNPAETAGGDPHIGPRSTYMRLDIGYVMAADAVVVLPGWQHSQGAVLEVLIAKALGLPVFEYGGERFPRGASVEVLGATVETQMVAA